MIHTRAYASVLTIVVLSFPAMGQVDAGPYQSICEDATTLQAGPLGPGEIGSWDVLIGSGVFMDPGDPLSEVTGLTMGTNILEWTVTDSLGNSASGTVTIVSYASDVSTSPGPDQTITTTTTTMQASGCDTPCQCGWSSDDPNVVITNDADPNTTVSNLSPGANVFAWACYNGPCLVNGGTGGTPVTVTIFVDLNTSLSQASWTGPQLRYDAINQRLVHPGHTGSIGVLDQSGRIILSAHGPEVDLRSLQAGIYIARSNSRQASQTFRFALVP